MNTNVRDANDEVEVLEIFEEAEDPVLTSVEVAEELDITQQAAHAKLSDLAGQGVLVRKKVGARAVVWWRPDQDSDEESR